MAFTIPSGLKTLYHEVCDQFIDNDIIGQPCRLIYPGKRVNCTNCISNPFGGVSSNVYRNGGPAPFTFGNCPLCGGSGYKETSAEETINMRIYHTPAEWRKLAIAVQVPDGGAVFIAYMTDLPKIEKANEIIILSNSNYTTWTYKLSGEPFPHGFYKERYIGGILERA